MIEEITAVTLAEMRYYCGGGVDMRRLWRMVVAAS